MDTAAGAGAAAGSAEAAAGGEQGGKAKEAEDADEPIMIGHTKTIAETITLPKSAAAARRGSSRVSTALWLSAVAVAIILWLFKKALGGNIRRKDA